MSNIIMQHDPDITVNNLGEERYRKDIEKCDAAEESVWMLV
tara:strand:- start:79 stop:201 length:123 start_codon:yes stop_codon:yes gene_type:complete